MTNWSDLEWDDSNTDEQKILTRQKEYVPCRICREIFQRVRMTLRYCNTCKRGFCEGEHGNFVGGGRGVCVRCYKKSQNGSELLQSSD